ncbi:MAG: hypothetical protein NTX65_06755 [Ignavibacteriales bacterium]|nr:hypothetical protein [Ignavibacteriales bacterium]
MKRTTLFWLIAIVVTLISAFYQRVTGPTFPLSGKVILDRKEIACTLERSHSSSSNYLIEIITNDSSIHGKLYFRKFNTQNEFSEVNMTGGEILKAELPAQKRLEKLEYYIMLFKDQSSVKMPAGENIIIRFKDDVPLVVLIPHIFAMFFAMMLSTRTGLELFNKEPRYEKLGLWTVIVLFIGGFALGFAMNGLAFGDIWGGWPFGHDVTDNKTQIAFIIWLFAFYMIKKNKKPGWWAMLAALVMIVIYSIPHSL